MANDVPASSAPDHDDAAPASSLSPQFWFEDGSVIVALAKERFKLHRSLLNRHSALFASLPSSTSTDVPTVEIPGELANAKDFAALLRHLYHDVYVRRPSHPAFWPHVWISSTASSRDHKANRLCPAACSVVSPPGHIGQGT